MMTVEPKLRYTVAALALIAAAFPVLRLADIIDPSDSFVWSMIFICWIILNSVLAKVTHPLFGNILANNLVIAFLIVTMVIGISGYEKQVRYRFWHSQNESVIPELKNVLYGHYADYVYVFRETDYGTEVDLLLESSHETDNMEKQFQQLFSEKINKSPNIQLEIIKGDPEKVYALSGLIPGDLINAKIDWGEARIYKRAPYDIYHYSELRGRCFLLIPLSIDNKKIFIDIDSVPEFTKDHFGAYAESFLPEERDVLNKMLLVSSKLKFANGPYDSVFDKVKHDGYGNIAFDYEDLKELPYTELDFIHRNRMKYDCDNSFGAQTIYMSYIKDPYLNMMLFPHLVNSVTKWEREEKIVYMGFVDMFDDFAYKLPAKFGIYL